MTNLVTVQCWWQVFNNKTRIKLNSIKVFPPLILATENGHTDIVKLLIENKAKVNDLTVKNYSALLKGWI